MSNTSISGSLPENTPSRFHDCCAAMTKHKGKVGKAVFWGGLVIAIIAALAGVTGVLAFTGGGIGLHVLNAAISTTGQIAMMGAGGAGVVAIMGYMIYGVVSFCKAYANCRKEAQTDNASSPVSSESPTEEEAVPFEINVVRFTNLQNIDFQCFFKDEEVKKEFKSAKQKVEQNNAMILYQAENTDESDKAGKYVARYFNEHGKSRSIKRSDWNDLIQKIEEKGLEGKVIQVMDMVKE